MKKFCLIAIAVLGNIVGTKAQNTPPIPYPAGTAVNYVRTWDVITPITDPASLTIQSPLQQAHVSTTYLDGLGRSIQVVTKQGSLTADGQPRDLVSPILYDALGREADTYLPFAANATGGNASIDDGLFKLNPFQQQEAFCQQQYPGEHYYYSHTEFEASPLSRPLKSLPAGDSWVGANKGTALFYGFNTTNDAVRIWDVTNAADIGTWGSYASTSAYLPGTLYKTITTDEHQHQVIEFKDKEQRTILKKVQLSAANDDGSGSGHAGWLCTYYIYDDLGLLRCVVQPRGVELLAQNAWNMDALSGDILNEQCFRYEYDERSRMIVKKVPGAAPVQMVYDARDRLVMTQDGNLHQKHQWQYTQYDELNRPVATGVFTDDNNYDQPSWHSIQAANSAAYPDLSQYNSEELTHNFYDDYAWITDPSNSGQNFSATRSTRFDGNLTIASDQDFPYPQPVTQTASTTGMLTGTRVKMLGSNPSKYLYSIHYYDDYGRVIQDQSQNNSGGVDITTNQYSFAGQLLVSVLRHQKDITANPFANLLVTKRTYDNLLRLTRIDKSITAQSGSITAFSAPICQMAYDALGNLKQKVLAPQFNNQQGLETLSYDYNIRGWLLGMNRSYAKSTSNSSDHYFGFDLGYDKTDVSDGTNALGSYANPEYNGNISGMLWKSAGDQEIRKYDFTYDAANRLASAPFTQYTNGSFNSDKGIDFSVYNLSYDANGNIRTMDQIGWQLALGSNFIDQLKYTYYGRSNRLKNVIDLSNDENTKLGDFRTGAGHPQKDAKNSYVQNPSSVDPASITDYNYDVNGNLVTDYNKDIKTDNGAGIEYNILNLPQKINVAGKGTIEYTYDANGNKLAKTVTEAGKITTTTYIGPFLYESKQGFNDGSDHADQLQFVSHEEGRLRAVATPSSDNPFAMTSDYFIKDHLGNVRMMLTTDVKTDPYPAATMEASAATTEESFYSNLPETRTDITQVSGYPQSSGNQYAAKVNGSLATTKIGPAITLRVMAGDKFNVRADSWYKANSATPAPSESPLYELLNAMSSGIGSLKGSKATVDELGNSPDFVGNIGSFFNQQNSQVATSRPKAYLNWVLFDEQFNYVTSYSDQVPDESYFQNGTDNLRMYNHPPQTVSIDKSGYLYVFVSNETPNIDVFFDNLQVTHVRGPLLEETHYYPFGLTMAGISSQALNFGKPENKKKYNGIELDKDLELNEYEAQFRDLDPQTARWWQLDPKTDGYENISPYTSMYDDPVIKADPLGDEPEQCCEGAWEAVKALFVTSQAVNQTVSGKAADQVRQAGKNFQARWNAQVDPVHQVMADPLSMISGEGELNLVENALKTEANEGSQVLKAVEKYEVGTAKDLSKASAKDGLDIHHTPQSQPASQVISGYDKSTAPAIALPEAEHKVIPTLKGTNTAGNARQQLAKDIKDLRNNTNAPNSSLQKLIDLNKKTYPEAFKKTK